MRWHTGINRLMTVVRVAGIICFLIILTILLSCSENKKSEVNKDNVKKINKLMETMARPDQEAVTLLSQKYELQPDLVEHFFDEYFTLTDLEYKTIKDSLRHSGTEKSTDVMTYMGLQKENYSQSLSKAAQTVGITQKTAALLVLDYRILTGKNRSNE